MYLNSNRWNKCIQIQIWNAISLNEKLKVDVFFYYFKMKNVNDLKEMLSLPLHSHLFSFSEQKFNFHNSFACNSKLKYLSNVLSEPKTFHKILLMQKEKDEEEIWIKWMKLNRSKIIHLLWFFHPVIFVRSKNMFYFSPFRSFWCMHYACEEWRAHFTSIYSNLTWCVE